MYCKNCGNEVKEGVKFCENCGKGINELGNNNININVINSIDGGKKKNKWVTILLAIFLGGIGAHKFYEGKVGAGLLYLILCWTGIPAFFALFDIIIVLLNKPTYYSV